MANMARSETHKDNGMGGIEVLMQEGWATFADLEKIGSFAGQKDEITMDDKVKFTLRVVDRFLAGDYKKNKLFVSRELTSEERAIKFLWIAKAEKLDRARE